MKFKWKEGEEFTSEIWLLNDLPKKVDAGKVHIKLKAGDDEVYLLSWKFNALEANTNHAGPTVRTILPSWKTDRFELLVEVEGHPEFNSAYTMIYVPKKRPKKQSTAVLNQ